MYAFRISLIINELWTSRTSSTNTYTYTKYNGF